MMYHFIYACSRGAHFVSHSLLKSLILLQNAIVLITGIKNITFSISRLTKKITFMSPGNNWKREEKGWDSNEKQSTQDSTLFEDYYDKAIIS